jgi:hypothetical protein
MTRLTMITRDGSEADDLMSAAWIVLVREGHPAPPDQVMTVVHPPNQEPVVVFVARDQADPHPDDEHYAWPGLGVMGKPTSPTYDEATLDRWHEATTWLAEHHL